MKEKHLIKFSIKKLSIPLIYLDANIIIRIYDNRQRKIEGKPFDEDFIQLYDLIHNLTNKKKILAPEGYQKKEFEYSVEDISGRLELLTQISFGVWFLSRHRIFLQQMYAAMRGYAAGLQEIILDSREVFPHNPINQINLVLQNNLIIRARMPKDDYLVAKRKKAKSEIYQDFEKIRINNYERLVKPNDWYKVEAFAIYQLVKKIANKILRKETLSQEEQIYLEDDISQYLALLKQALGKNIDFNDLLDFLASDYFVLMPSNHIRSKLFSSLMTKKHGLKSSDSADVDHVCSLFPYCDYYVTDNDLANRISTKPVLITDEFSVQVSSPNSLKKLLSILSKV